MRKNATKFIVGALAAAFLGVAAFSVAGAAEKARGPGLVAADSKLLIVFANAGEGKEAEFNAYYDTHMKEIAALPNFVRVQKFEFSPRTGRPESPYKYVFIWEFTGDQNESYQRLQQWIKDGKIGTAGAGVVAKLEGHNYAASGPGYLGTLGK